MLLLELKTKFNQFWTKFWIKQVNLLLSKCASLMLYDKPVQANWLLFLRIYKKQFALWVLMKLKLLREMLLLNIFLHEKMRKNQKITERLCSETSCGFLTFCWALDAGCHICVVLRTDLVLAIFRHLQLPLKQKKKFIEFWTKFRIKQVKFLLSRCTNLVLHDKPVQQNWLRFFRN